MFICMGSGQGGCHPDWSSWRYKTDVITPSQTVHSRRGFCKPDLLTCKETAWRSGVYRQRLYILIPSTPSTPSKLCRRHHVLLPQSRDRGEGWGCLFCAGPVFMTRRTPRTVHTHGVIGLLEYSISGYTGGQTVITNFFSSLSLLLSLSPSLKFILYYVVKLTCILQSDKSDIFIGNFTPRQTYLYLVNC